MKKKQRFVKSLLFLHFIATGKFELLGILVLSRLRKIGIQAPHIQNPVRFRRFTIGQFQKISIPNHGWLPCFNPPLPSGIPECVTPHALRIP